MMYLITMNQKIYHHQPSPTDTMAALKQQVKVLLIQHLAWLDVSIEFAKKSGEVFGITNLYENE